MNGDKQKATEIVVKKGKLESWLDNYWYHYKWPTIIVAFFLIVFLVCTLQLCTKESSDIMITYAGSAYLKTDQQVMLENALEKALPEELAGKKEVTTGVNSYYILSKEQIEKLQNQTDEEGYKIDPGQAFVTEEMSTFTKYIQTGDTTILILEPWIYAELFENGETDKLVSLQEALGAKPEGANDDYSVRLGDTKLYQKNPQLNFLPEDSLICCLKNDISSKKKQALQIEAFKVYAQLAEKTNDGE